MRIHPGLPKLLLAGTGILCLLPHAPPALALGAGIALSLLPGFDPPPRWMRLDRHLLQASVVLLGIGLDPQALLRAGLEGFWFSGLLLAVVFALGRLAPRLLGCSREASLMVSAGTAICGGSAIAAVAAARRSPRDEIALALTTVFLLNAAALLIFPPVGHLVGMSPESFGRWAGLGIQDISSVVGASSSYAPAALPTALAVKLSRTLWILPVSVLASRRRTDAEAPSKRNLPVPAFLLGFVAMSLASAQLPALAAWEGTARIAAHGGFGLALFLIGLSFDAKRLRRDGARLLIQGTLQWLLLAGGSLAWVLLR